MESTTDTLRDDLTRLFAHDDFRAGQREIVESVMAGADTLAVLPTGGGKSLTYQLPAMLLPGATLVLSPLIALMKDQAENLPPEVAARTTIINSSMSPSEVGRRISQVKSGQVKMIYAAPERLRQAPFLHALDRAGVSLVVVDEAHCISQWGHDFRPDYRAVGTAIGAMEARSVLAVTATATGEVQDDIERQVGRPMRRILRPTFRDNLYLSCVKVTGEDEKLRTTLDLCRDSEGSGLVYAGSREKCEQLARMLKRYGIEAGFYHAGLPPQERAAAQDRFMSGEIRVMVATVAFGMGVDKSDIRFLIHYHPSRSLENYYQEAGRAGRDGELSRCTLLFSAADGASVTRHLREDAIGYEQIKSVYAAVRQNMERRRIGPVAFDSIAQTVGGDDGMVRSALPLLEEAGLIRRGTADLPRGLTIECVDEEGGGDEFEARAESTEWADFSARAGSGNWDPTALSQATGIPLADLEETLLRFQDAGHLTYRAAPRDLLIELLPPPPDSKERMQATLAHRAKAAGIHAGAMQDYARERKCRHGLIARYFADRWPNVKCGMCDICSPQAASRSRSADESAARREGQPAANPPVAALQIVHDLGQGYRAFALGKPGLARALRGTPDAPIKEGRTPAFGALADMKKADVERLIDALIERGYLNRDEDDEYRRLTITAEGRNALVSGEAADIRWQLPVAMPSGGIAGATSGADAVLSPADAPLLDALKTWRRETALEDNVPPYVVFADKVLVGIAARRPANEFDLLEISGIGPAKAAKYGTMVLDLVARHPGE